MHKKGENFRPKKTAEKPPKPHRFLRKQNKTHQIGFWLTVCCSVTKLARRVLLLLLSIWKWTGFVACSKQEAVNCAPQSKTFALVTKKKNKKNNKSNYRKQRMQNKNSEEKPQSESGASEMPKVRRAATAGKVLSGGCWQMQMRRRDKSSSLPEYASARQH